MNIELTGFQKSLDSAHQTLREHRESLDSLFNIVNNNVLDIKDMRNSQSSLLGRIDKIDAVLNDSYRMIHELGSSVRTVDREQQIMMMKLVENETTARDTYNKLSSHIVAETDQYANLHKSLIRISAGIVGLVVVAHGLYSLLNGGNMTENISKLMEMMTGG